MARHHMETHDVDWPAPLQTLQATEGQTEELRGHVIIAGFGRVGQIIGQLLAERLIPFVAVDVRMDCVQVSNCRSHPQKAIGELFLVFGNSYGSMPLIADVRSVRQQHACARPGHSREDRSVFCRGCTCAMTK